MNYAAASVLLPCCSSCGEECHEDSMVLYRFELICPTCREDHDAASAREKAWDEFEERNRARPAEEQRD